MPNFFCFLINQLKKQFNFNYQDNYSVFTNNSNLQLLFYIKAMNAIIYEKKSNNIQKPQKSNQIHISSFQYKNLFIQIRINITLSSLKFVDIQKIIFFSFIFYEKQYQYVFVDKFKFIEFGLINFILFVLLNAKSLISFICLKEIISLTQFYNKINNLFQNQHFIKCKIKKTDVALQILFFYNILLTQFSLMKNITGMSKNLKIS
ncbi:transmembrane protein, putative (macronuclear) [Tetrahymena thermophila SB210]|uniref:Transmembrane protein, putative n=1 Tax=Tetrahymena thermophila (strain SB210) TaxID=312017 RepID=W7XHZ8_TETTS|nr:transmembrane protein, putative [Tetrahymena thermophila SB210]EWS74211.1 transmembrane protein, putative [Tetrahymena thermophila SB210]|eukprot:XP_012653271.1 transmembrane protein, putative [Tetrahymena thermophila SB210]